ncbi:Spectrin beta chain [Nymphon striatum]|nr:Spectrin beta chain [Nymphon striatum]
MPQKKRSLKGLSSVNKKATNLQSKSSPVESHCFVCYDDLVMCGTYASAKNVFSLPKGKPPSITIQLKKVLGKEFAEQVISDKICSRCERNLYRIYRNKLNRIPFLVKFKQTTLKYGYLKMSKKYSVLSADKTKVRMLDMVIQLINAGRDLINEKPEYAETIEPKLQDLAQRFEDLENTTKTKGQKLFDANRQVIYEQTCDDIDGWITDLEGQMLAGETGQDLTSVNLTLKKHERLKWPLKPKQVEELESQAQHLQEMDPDKTDEIKAKKVTVEGRFQQLQAPLLSKKLMLEKKKEALQFRRDMEDERSWIREKMPLAESKDYGNSLFGVQMLLKKNQSLRTEIDNHEPRINYVCDNGRKLISEDHEDSEEFQNLIEELISMWKELIDAMDYRKSKLAESQRAQQYYFDVSEAEAWMSEQELYMMGEERGKDEISAQNLMKKHESLENAVEDYTETVRQLGETARQLINEGHPESDQIAVRQSQVDKLYAGLKDLASERRGKLDEALKLFMLNREVDDLVQWIAEREVVAGSHELGQDYDHVTMLRERFKQFAHDTETTGTERVAAVNYIADQLIASRHSDAATIAEWKDNLNEAWGDLLELIETRTQMLAASWSLHRFFHDCKDVYGRILEKQKSMSDELGRDAGSVSVLLRKHANFEHDLQTLASRVQEIQEDSDKLQASYAGDKAREITSREADVVNAWLNLQGMCEARKAKLSDTGDLFKFFNMVRTLMLWMDDLTRQMNSFRKTKIFKVYVANLKDKVQCMLAFEWDVSGVELLMNNHQSLKAEIDAREDKMSECISLGKELLERNHYASPEIKEKLVALTNQRTTMMTRWEERWEHLQLILEVYQFARDAAVAETWLISQDPYLLSQELGHTLDEVDLLIKRHEAFEKSAAAQEERFSALERLTTLELKDQEGRQNEDQAERRQAYKELDDHMRQSGIFEQFEVKEYHKKQQQEEERLRQEELAKASPKSASPDQHDDRPDGEGSPEHDHGFENGEREAIAETAAEVSTTPGVKSSRASRASSTTSSVSSAPISANERTPKVGYVRTAFHRKEKGESAALMEEVMKCLESLESLWGDFESGLGVTARLWSMYIDMMLILRRYIHAERAGLWQQHLQEVRNMLPYTIASGHSKYMSCLPIYLNEMQKLPETPPEVHEEFAAGKFTVHQTAGDFNGVWTNLAMAFIQPFNTLGSSTFGQLQERYRDKFLNMKPRHCTEVHFVGNQYDFELKILKCDERQRRESNINLPEYVPADSMKIPDWKTLLSNSCNRTNMLSYLASRWSQEASWPAGFCLVLGVNAQATRVTQTEHTDVDELYCPNHEEADTRIFAHIASCDDNNVFVIQTTDTDIIFLAMYHFPRLPNVVELWVEKNDLFLFIHDLVNELAKAVGKDVLALTDTLLISYILSSCNSVSYPFKRGKKRTVKVALEHVDKHPTLSNCIQHESGPFAHDQVITEARSFFCDLYGKPGYLSLDKLRAHLFASSKLDLRSLPPTEDAFHFHVLRSLCQICLYKQASFSNPVLLPPEEYGRIVDVEGTKQLPVNVTHPKSTPPPPPPAMSAEKDKKKRRSRSKSPFSSWRKKKSTPSVTDDELAHQQDADAARDEEEPCEGVLTRKHQWESTAKKASNRSWEKVYMVLKGNMLFAYKDQKHSKQEPETFFRNESPSNLSAAVADVASEYAKKKNVFKLNFNNGGEYLFQARDEDEMNTWVQRLRQATDGSAGPSRSQTLPASASREVEKKDEPKAKRGFFTLKRK